MSITIYIYTSISVDLMLFVKAAELTFELAIVSGL